MSNTTYEPSLWEKFMDTFIYPIFIFFHEFNKNYMTVFYVVLLIALICLIFYVYFNNPFQIITTIPIPFLVVSVLLFLFLSLKLCSQFENPLRVGILNENMPEMMMGVVYFIVFFIFFCGLYYVCKKILLFSSGETTSLLFIQFVLIFALIYSMNKNIANEDKNAATFINTFKNFVFAIPCFMVDGWDAFTEDIKQAPSSTIILLIILALIFLICYIIPYIQKIKIKSGNYVQLLQTPTELNREILYLSNDELKDKVIANKPFLERKILTEIDTWESQIKAIQGQEAINIQLYESGLSGETDVSGETGAETFCGSIYEHFDTSMSSGIDANLKQFNIMNLFTPNERAIIQNALNDATQNISNLVDTLEDPNEISDLYMNFIANHSSYGALLSNINEWNNTKDEYIYQESSKLIAMINRMNNISEYNYHYGISFWVFFDPEILKMDSGEIEGLIMNYAYTPYIYFNYQTNELTIETNKCNVVSPTTSSVSCKQRNVIYKSKNILYQKWNNIIINYDYGTLDIFINNELVSTQKNVSPYIEEGNNIIQFGSNDLILKNCALCDIRYYNTPLMLNEIKNIYGNKSNPCK